MKLFHLLSLITQGLFILESDSFVLEGSSTSYAQFRKWYPTGKNSSIKFEYKSKSSNGILLYMDDGGYHDFIEIKLVNDSVRTRYNFGTGSRVLSVPYSKFKKEPSEWISIEFAKIDDGTTALCVDGVYAERGLFSPEISSSFGNYSQNSHVYVGGLPSWYLTKLSNLALPSVVYEPRFQGAVRNLVYGDDPSGVPKKQEVMAYKGVRASTVDTCHHHNPCHNGGLCISTDGGPVCECKYIDFDGVFCERGHEPVEVSLNGKEYLSYDLQKLAGQPILSDTDDISLYFKTNRPDGFLFLTGDEEDDFLCISLKDGTISLIVQLGMGKLNTGINNHQVRFDDNKWHHLTIKRSGKQLTNTRSACHILLTVDGIYSEKWMTTGMFYMLASSKVFIGGSDENTLGQLKIPNFIGCLKKVEFSADSLYLPILKLAKEASRLIVIHGRIGFNCRPTPPVLPVAFTSGDTYLVLPSWNSTSGGSFSFTFRTNEPNGLLFYNQGLKGASLDVFAIEILEGYLYLHLNLGPEALKIRASNQRLDDGTWHKIEIFLRSKSGTIKVNEDFQEFAIPGESNGLELLNSLYVGNIDHLDIKITPPPSIWSASLNKGFVGCLRDLEMNGNHIDLHHFVKHQDSGSILTSCHITPPKCTNRPCLNGGVCVDGWGRYICDCSLTGFNGPICGKAASILQFDGSQRLSISNPGEGATEAENIVLRFRTPKAHGFLFELRDNNGGNTADKLEFLLIDGKIEVFLKMGLTEKKLIAGNDLGDDKWHNIHFKRRGMILSLAIDGNAPILAEAYGSMSTLGHTVLNLASRLYYTESLTPFSGHMQQFIFNGREYFEMIRSGTLVSSYSLTGVFYDANDSDVYHDVTFLSHHTYMGLPQLKTYANIDLYFRLRTLETDGIIMFNAGRGQDFIAVELSNGHIHYVLNLGYGVINLRDNSPRKINDNKWHTVSIGRPSQFKHTLRVDTYHSSANSKGNESNLDLDGILFLGGVRKNMYSKLPSEIISTYGYQGCLACIELNGVAGDPINKALVPSNQVSKGCEEEARNSRNNYELSDIDTQYVGLNYHRKQQIQNHFRQQELDSSIISRCSCENDGICIEHGGSSPTCDCDLTSFSGPRCTEESVAYEWSNEPGLIRYNFPYDKRPDTRIDVLSLGIITPLNYAIIVRIDSASSNDFLEMQIEDGYIHILYNLGTEDIMISDKNILVNDGNYHVIKFTRSEANSTLQIDDHPTQFKYPIALRRQLTVFNSQSQIHVGGKWNPTSHKIEKSFQGIIAGLVYNGLRPLDLVANRDGGAKIHGRNVKIVENIPFDYRDTHSPLFRRDNQQGFKQMQMTNPSKYPDPGINDDLIYSKLECDEDEEKYYNPRCFAFEGSGDELITPVYTPPYNPLWKNRNTIQNCDDEEDCNTSTEGSGHSHDSTTKAFVYTTEPSPPTTWAPWETTSTPFEEMTQSKEKIVEVNEESSSQRPPIIYENYDTKYNVYDNEPEPKTPIYDTDRPRVTSAATSSTIMVISIILVAIIAIILIIFIVLRMRTRDEDRGYKVEESRTYQFDSTALVSSSNTTNNADLDEGEGGSLLGNTTSSNGFYARNLAVVKKPSSSSSSSKPIREWYV
ncbi:neurexin 1 isoform X2 [Lepeophtheirus salmonis]|uniref:neurexin 1 isoform X2 n=1 Tax=Lepeophtheirus salmonis TaxID=72036 RepID=UPI003AF3FEA0